VSLAALTRLDGTVSVTALLDAVTAADVAARLQRRMR
jgi:hypothetical protein